MTLFPLVHRFFFGLLCLLTFLSLTLSQGAAQGCNTGNFPKFLEDFAQEARRSGLSEFVLQNSLRGLTLDRKVIQMDRAQAVFSQSFSEFSGRMVSENRLQVGRKKIASQAALLARIERRFGVPAAPLVAFWGLETDFGANTGHSQTLRSLATLAYDCRRSAFFREHLLNALRIIQRGDLTPSQMRGAWAGEIGQTQFLPSEYLEVGVDFDGDGRVDMINSTADALASSANLLRRFGWRPGQPWLLEVRVPQDMPWEQADLDIFLPQAQWAKWGVRLANGSSLPRTGLQAALLLPMGRNGPAFLAYPNFLIFLKWNQSLVYSTTAAYYATRLEGAPRHRAGNGPVQVLSFEQIKLLQMLLMRQGYDSGGVDGKIGLKTRKAVRNVQQKLGLPADSYPTSELLRRLQTPTSSRSAQQ